MSTVLEVERFISGKKGEVTLEGAHAHHAPGVLPFVTVSRQTGAGGRQLAEELLRQLSEDTSGDPRLQNWRIFDRSMCEIILKNENLANSMNELLDEKYHSQIQEFLLGLAGRRGMQNAAYPKLAHLLRTVASVGRVVIIGYGGFQATRELPGGIDVRLIAPLSLRVSRMAQALGESEADTEHLIQKRDEERRRVLRTHYNVDSSDPELYDMVFNTQHVSPKTIARVLVSLIKQPQDQ